MGCVPLKLWAKAGAPLGSGCHLLTPVLDLAEISHGAALSFIFLIYKMQILLAALWLHQCEDVLMENLWTFLEISSVLPNIKLVVNIVIFFPKLLYLISLLSFIPFLGNCNHPFPLWTGEKPVGFNPSPLSLDIIKSSSFCDSRYAFL